MKMEGLEGLKFVTYFQVAPLIFNGDGWRNEGCEF